MSHGPGKGKTNSTPAQQDLISTLKSEMKSRGIPFGKIEKGADGAPKIGKLYGFDIMKDPVKTADGPGMGHGPMGAVRQGPNERQAVGGGPGGGGTPFLKGVRVYQQADLGAKSGVKRSIMTFRVASSKHASGGKRWEHPGNSAQNILQEGLDWALTEFESKIAPEIMAKIVTKI
jgi:hypothetical protein